MFSLAAGLGIAITAGLAKWQSERDRERYDKMPSATEDEYLRAMLLHIRQDLQLGIYMLGLAIIFLGIIADAVSHH